MITVSSSRSEVFCEIGSFKNFAKFTVKHLCQNLFFNKVAGLRPATLLKKRFWHRCFHVNFTKFLRKPIFIEHLWWLLLYGGVLKSTQDYYQTHKTTSLKTIHKRLIYGSRKMLFLFAFLQITASDCNVSDTDAIRITIAMKLCRGILMSD